MKSEDVDVLSVDMIEPENARHFKNPWIVMWANGKYRTYKTEKKACAVQQAWRKKHNIKE